MRHCRPPERGLRRYTRVALITAILGFIVGGAVFFIWGITNQRKDAVNLEAAHAEAEQTTNQARTKSELLLKEAELKAKNLIVGAQAHPSPEMPHPSREI